MKQLVLKTKYAVLALLVAFTFSCDGEDGAPGTPGAEGPAGINGTNGNANVQAITFDATAFAGTFDEADIPQLTQDVLDNDAILTYLNSGTWFPVPCPADTFGFDHAVDVNLSVGTVTFDYSNGSGAAVSITAGDLVSGRVVIIESTSTTAGKTSSKQQVYNELNQAGVNINDYYAVCDYYGIAY